MRIQLIEHDPEDFSCTNISFWAADKGYRLLQTYICNGEELPSLDTFDWLMVMGGSQHAWDEGATPWLQMEKAFLSEALSAGKIILGICFGAQLLAEALGGDISTNPQKEIGWYDVKLSEEGQDSFLFQRIPHTFVTFHWHSDHFLLPGNCTRLAFSDATINQAFVCKDGPQVGIQFHPEYTRQMVRYFAREHSQDWIRGMYVSSKTDVLSRTDKILDTYWLMEHLLNNMEHKFAMI